MAIVILGRVLTSTALIKYNRPSGTVILSSLVEGKRASLSVRNTGAGIPFDLSEQVFDRFYRSDVSHNNETGGHGLGLSIAREIARAHGGDVALVRSDPEWTEFSLVLSIKPGDTTIRPEI